MNQSQTDLSVQKTVTVETTQQRAFDVFTRHMTSWWPMESHHIAEQPAEEIVIEPRVEGRWFERAADGTECVWGRVLAWDPPDRVVLDWQLNADFAYDPEIHTDVEVRFVAEAENRTRVELEHRGLRAYGEKAESMRVTFSSSGGWTSLMEAFATAASV